MRYVRMLVLGLLILISAIALGAVLTTDTNHDGVLNIASVQKGQDLVLVKTNPSTLPPNAVVFQTKQYNVYTAATLEDLKDPAASKKIVMAKMQKNGSVKIYTLRNVGYVGIQSATDPSGQTNYFLVDAKGKLDKITVLPLNQPPLAPYDPTADLKKTPPKSGR